MNRYNKKIATSILGLLASATVMAQDEGDQEDKLGGDLVKIGINYIPKTKKAVKIQAVPTMKNEEMGKKYKPKYDFINVGVDNDFEVSELKATKQARKRKYPRYNNYIKTAYGNNASPLAELFYTYDIDPEQYLGLRAFYTGGNPKIKNIHTPAKYNELNTALFYKSESDNYQTTASVGYDMNQLYYYGFKSKVEENPKRNTLSNIHAHADIKANRITLFKDASVDVNLFSDKYKTSELAAKLKGNLKYNFLESFEKFNYDAFLKLESSLLNGKIGSLEEDNKYKFLNFSAQPQVGVSRGMSSFKIGAKVLYHSDGEIKENSKVHVFPALSGRYTLSNEMNIYANLDGGLEYKGYSKQAGENHFVNYNHLIKPTKTTLNAKIGVKGNIYSALAYKLEGGVKRQKDYAFRKASTLNSKAQAYNYDNSFDLIYDKLNTTYFNGTISYIMTKDLDVKWNIYFAQYGTNQEKAWNTPTLKSELGLSYDLFNHKLNVGADLYYIGRRFDQVNNEIEKVNAYVDLNLKAYYKVTRRLSVFTHATNLFGNYDYYYAYPTQGITIMGGLKYKF